jgi:hypothetical protein
LPIPVFLPGAQRALAFPEQPAPGLRETVDHLMRAYAYNINIRIADEGRPNVADSLRVHEIGVRRDGYVPDIDLGCAADACSEAAAAPPMEPVVVYPEDDHGVQVSAVLVQHAPVFPAFGFRFDTPHGAVVFSGDTGHCENVVRLAPPEPGGAAQPSGECTHLARAGRLHCNPCRRAHARPVPSRAGRLRVERGGVGGRGPPPLRR